MMWNFSVIVCQDTYLCFYQIQYVLKQLVQTSCKVYQWVPKLNLFYPAIVRSPKNAYVEGDASSASYFLAGAAITGGTVTVEGCGTTSLQVKFWYKANFFLKKNLLVWHGPYI